MTDVTLNIPARTPHLCSVLTGFILLEKQGKLRLKLNTNVKMPSASIMEAIIDGKRLAYDMADGYNFRDPAEIERYIDSCDFYFKRSFSDGSGPAGTMLSAQLRRKRLFQSQSRKKDA